MNPNDDNKAVVLTPEQLKELKEVNPVAHARYLAETPIASANPADVARAATMTPKEIWKELKQANPIAAARYALENNLFRE